MEGILATLPKDDPNAHMKLLFRLWSDHYNDHMRKTGHDAAVDTLLKQLVSLEPIFAKGGMQPIIGKKVLEMSCGTGMVIRMLHDNRTGSAARDVKYTLNDISKEMQDMARGIMRGTDTAEDITGKCIYTKHDLRVLGEKFTTTFNTIILSQTLHLIADEETLKKDGVCMPNDEAHLQEKREVILSAFKLLEPGGKFILMDEWPARLSNEPSKDATEAAITYLFNRTFKPLESSEKFRELMRSIPEARSVVELRIPIDPKHAMHVIVCSKDPDKARYKRAQLPTKTKFSANREAAFKLAIEAFETTAPHLQETFTRLNGNAWVTLLSLNDNNRLVISDTKQGIAQEPKYDSVVLKGCFHSEDADRNDVIRKAMAALKTGGSLIIADEWIPPASIQEPTPRSEFPGIMTQFGKSITHVGEIRVPIVATERNGDHIKHNSAIYANMYYKNKPSENGHNGHK